MAPFTVEEGKETPRDLESEMSSAISSLLLRLKQEKASSELQRIITGSILVRSQQAMTLPAVPVELVAQGSFEDYLPMELIDILSQDLAPALTTRALQGVRSSLAVQFEMVPYSREPKDQRGERYASFQEATRFLSKVAKYQSPSGVVEGERTQTVIGRTIWNPSLMAILVPQEEIRGLLTHQGHLGLQKVTLQVGEGEVELLPEPWGRIDLVDARINPLVSLPLQALGWPPTKAQISAAATHYLPDSQARKGLEELAGIGDGSREWWTLAELFNPLEEKSQTNG
jgi:hypothetical protein